MLCQAFANDLAQPDGYSIPNESTDRFGMDGVIFLDEFVAWGEGLQDSPLP